MNRKTSFVSYNRLSELLQTLNTNKTVSYFPVFERLIYCMISLVNEQIRNEWTCYKYRNEMRNTKGKI